MVRALLLMVASLVALPVLAGCIAPAVAPDGQTERASFGGELAGDRLAAPEEDFSKVVSGDHGGIPHGHAVGALHEGSFGMELVGYNPLTGVNGGVAPLWHTVGYTGMHVWETFLCIAGFAGPAGAVILDVANPAEPKVLSKIESGMVNSDCQFTDDGNTLLVAAYTGVGNGIAPGTIPVLGDLAARGVLAYDVTDKSNPRFLFHDTKLTNGDSYHNVFTRNIHGRDYVFQTYTGHVLAIKEDRSGLEEVVTLEHSDHDMWVGRHPVTGQWVMATGAGRGTAVFNLEDPTAPVLMGVWESSDDLRGWHRQWPVAQTVDGRALLVVAGETGGGATLPYAVVDWTDPSELVTLGAWQVPGKPISPAPNFFTLSAHEFEIWNGYVVSANYHAGIWLFDVASPERALEPVTLGYYMPTELPPTQLGVNAPWAWSPYVWSVAFDARGYVFGVDWSTGLYVLKFDGTEVA